MTGLDHALPDRFHQSCFRHSTLTQRGGGAAARESRQAMAGALLIFT
jgi:hypothetical protein